MVPLPVRNSMNRETIQNSAHLCVGILQTTITFTVPALNPEPMSTQGQKLPRLSKKGHQSSTGSTLRAPPGTEEGGEVFLRQADDDGRLFWSPYTMKTRIAFNLGKSAVKERHPIFELLWLNRWKLIKIPECGASKLPREVSMSHLQRLIYNLLNQAQLLTSWIHPGSLLVDNTELVLLTSSSTMLFQLPRLAYSSAGPSI